MRREYLGGQTFGRLTVIEYAGARRWRCVCACGNESTPLTQELKRGREPSCGCARREALSQARTQDITGKVFGVLMVQQFAGHNGHRKATWKCICRCGASVVVVGSSLVSGNTTSCGCLKAEKARAGRFVDLTGRSFGRLSVVQFLGFQQSKSTWLCLCECGSRKIARGADLMNGMVISCGCARKDRPGIMPLSARSKCAAIRAKRRARISAAEGCFTARDIDRLLRLQRGCCACCSRVLRGSFHRDHIVPLARGGTNDIYNIQLTCPTCNQRKHAKDPIEWAQSRGFLL